MAETASIDGAASDTLLPIRRVIERSCRLLDACEYARWLDLCAKDFRYTVQVYSTEIRRDVVWLEKDREGMKLLLEQLPMHFTYKGSYRRLLGWTDLVMFERPEMVVESSISVFHTDVHGASSLYCTGIYRDRIRQEGGERPVLSSRTVVLDTRRVPFGSPVAI